ncbi:hypothetical protein [Algihabitans albus]|uniref:hypothetical protein n=1 Tax=Algihabitans albus TaxID=2164067 RepID=UPI000E5CFBFF|nr:hypothetical protein [Algihabitans albus]
MLLILLAAATGVALTMPGISLLNAGGIGIQPLLPLLGAVIAAGVIARGGIPIGALGWLMMIGIALALSSLASVDPGASLLYFTFQLVTAALAALGFGYLLSERSLRVAFLNGYIFGALVSAAASVLQFATSTFLGFAFRLANNQNFELLAPWGRGMAFTAEASLLATVMMPALLAVYLERQREDSVILPIFRTLPAMLLLLAGYVASKSSTIVFLLPALLLAETLMQRDLFGALRKYARHLVFFLLLAAAFFPIYQSRLAATDAQFSSAGRLEKMVAGIAIAGDHPVFGAGPGMVSDPIFFDPYVNHIVDWSWKDFDVPDKGIDSAVIRTLAESGGFGLLATYYPVLLLFLAAAAMARRPDIRPFLPIAICLLFSQSLVSGYRDLTIFYLPLVIGAVGAFICRGPVAAPVQPKPAHLLPVDRRLSREGALS